MNKKILILSWSLIFYHLSFYAMNSSNDDLINSYELFEMLDMTTEKNEYNNSEASDDLLIDKIHQIDNDFGHNVENSDNLSDLAMLYMQTTDSTCHLSFMPLKNLLELLNEFTDTFKDTPEMHITCYGKNSYQNTYDVTINGYQQLYELLSKKNKESDTLVDQDTELTIEFPILNIELLQKIGLYPHTVITPLIPKKYTDDPKKKMDRMFYTVSHRSGTFGALEEMLQGAEESYYQYKKNASYIPTDLTHAILKITLFSTPKNTNEKIANTLINALAITTKNLRHAINDTFPILINMFSLQYFNQEILEHLSERFDDIAEACMIAEEKKDDEITTEDHINQNLLNFIHKILYINLSNNNLTSIPDFLSFFYQNQKNCRMDKLDRKTFSIIKEHPDKEFIDQALCYKEYPDRALIYLDISHNNVSDINELFSFAKELRYLHASHNNIAQISHDITNMERLRYINFEDNPIFSNFLIKDVFYKFKNLRVINIPLLYQHITKMLKYITKLNGNVELLKERVNMFLAQEYEKIEQKNEELQIECTEKIYNGVKYCSLGCTVTGFGALGLAGFVPSLFSNFAYMASTVSGAIGGGILNTFWHRVFGHGISKSISKISCVKPKTSDDPKIISDLNEDQINELVNGLHINLQATNKKHSDVLESYSENELEQWNCTNVRSFQCNGFNALWVPNWIKLFKYVVRLNLDNNIIGDIDSLNEVLNQLTNLCELSISHNDLNTFPSKNTINNLTYLQYINMSKNKIAGTIPHYFSQVPWLNFENNNIENAHENVINNIRVLEIQGNPFNVNTITNRPIQNIPSNFFSPVTGFPWSHFPESSEETLFITTK